MFEHWPEKGEFALHRVVAPPMPVLVDVAAAIPTYPRMADHDTRDLAERAAADRDWTYRHIVV
ncbi:hypothetical protein, partial [Nocardia sp. 852002-20019_SCH5090214]|uniref:hypothetical protein n=1 Tax=Nocardia sp. 852002-20019_SCH5090214 TaxID=1834087 RepID=UPI0012E9BF14